MRTHPLGVALYHRLIVVWHRGWFTVRELCGGQTMGNLLFVSATGVAITRFYDSRHFGAKGQKMVRMLITAGRAGYIRTYSIPLTRAAEIFKEDFGEGPDNPYPS